MWHMFPHLRVVFGDARGSFSASALFEDESLPQVVSEPSNVRAYKNHYSTVENLHFPPYLLVGLTSRGYRWPYYNCITVLAADPNFSVI